VLLTSFTVDASGTASPGNVLPNPNLVNPNHGTCMASLATGLYSSMGKHSRLVTVQMNVAAQTLPNAPQGVRASRVVAGLQSIYNHAVSNGGIGNAVVSMSWGVPRQQLFFNQVASAAGLPPNDVFDTMFQLLWNIGISTVSSAGNQGNQQGVLAQYLDLAYMVPRQKGGTNSPHMVLGNCQYDSSRNPSSQYLDAGNLGILSLYAVGTNVDCAQPFDDQGSPANDLRWGIEPAGTSQATASTAGLIAYYLSRPDLNIRNVPANQVPMAVKNFVIAQANLYKGNAGAANLPNGNPDNVPRAASGDIVPCTNPTGAAPALNPFVPNPGFNRAFQTTAVTQGATVVINPVSCCSPRFNFPFDVRDS